ncbi:DNA polymerase [Corynebacterium belfantii]|uniref:DNA polymerase n=1 Tax=Corynebacterium belfantii TaxID=2014537 RepID=UPI000DF8D534|nr:DNA polymerase [Corynebacterium belfantii]QVI98763.1 DNA polymerase [Corynebacterium diphtheriae]MBG9243865.1 DNA polymerase [Corynebacterium belfantii]MBG9258879.1 DNA polymerase [Corynebacterium belfantii]MBG9265596.1 DNA polymerase [Corynebacterium belfantii]MBG9288434.1 DNA polymerase [Corynebacterium belfantii]
MRTLSLDLETYSPTNLATAGVYRYAEDEAFRILLFGYSIDGAPAKVIDLARGEPIPTMILQALVDPAVTKSAFNAAFERVCLSAYLRRHHPDLLAEGFLDPRGWRCTMVWAASLGLPMSLDGAAKALRLPIEKDPTGQKLIRRFSIPGKDGSRMLPSDDPIGWEQYISYNRRDVDVEVQLAARLTRNPMPDIEWETYWLDQRINDTGVRIDTALAAHAMEVDTHHRDACLARAQQLTGLENPNSPIQLKDWLAEHDCALESLTKAEVEAALETASGDVAEVLRLRQDLSRSSVKKYQAMLAVAGSDDRARGLIQYMGAGRTGRFAGRLIQVQNLPRNYLPDLASARTLLEAGNSDALELLYTPLPDTLSQLIRTAFIPSESHRFIVTDFSAIEARVLAWLAGETGTLQAFREGKDLYCQTASRMFGAPVEKHGANAELRQKGKIAVLACGYGGSVGALKAMGALRMGLDEVELKPLVDAWRDANPAVVQFWHDIEQAAITTVETRTPTQVGRIRLSYRSGCLFIALPSGRELCYPRPRLGENRFGMTSILFDGVDGTTRKWGPIETYGGKLTENLVQAAARDLLTHAMHHVDAAGHRIVMHIHDEIVVDEPADGAGVEDIVTLMTRLPCWADGLPLDADGYECSFYMKD